MVIRSQENALGAKAFLIGVILAVFIGTLIGLSTSGILKGEISPQQLSNYSSASYAVLVLLGIIVGFVGVSGKDAHTFMIAGAIVVVVSGFGLDSVRGSIIGIGVGDIASSIFGALSALFVPATIIVALKTVFSISKI
ncbi:hypothetical protein K9L16_03190 [Candidatus Pacearchaeota archaeon]|nr:hypothetical protein [Candidatus Pacearchaeota archaeon]